MDTTCKCGYFECYREYTLGMKYILSFSPVECSIVGHGYSEYTDTLHVIVKESTHA